MKYFRLDNLDKENATYNIAIGERSNGKTYACLERIIKNYFDVNDLESKVLLTTASIEDKECLQTY